MRTTKIVSYRQPGHREMRQILGLVLSLYPGQHPFKPLHGCSCLVMPLWVNVSWTSTKDKKKVNHEAYIERRYWDHAVRVLEMSLV